MGGDGGYAPTRSELVAKHDGKRKHIDHRWLASMYWDRHGNSYPKPSVDEILLKVCVDNDRVYCAVLNKKITRPSFAFPCGCVFEHSVLEFIRDGCPVCGDDAECFAEIHPEKETR